MSGVSVKVLMWGVPRLPNLSRFTVPVQPEWVGVGEGGLEGADKQTRYNPKVKLAKLGRSNAAVTAAEAQAQF